MVSPVGDTSAYPVGPVLPVKPGYYALAGTPCAHVTARSVLILYRDGMDWMAGSCAWSEVSRLPGQKRAYRVKRRCVVGQQEGISDGKAYTRTATFRLHSDTAFSLQEDGKTTRAAFCAQGSLPEPWRSQPPIG